MSVALLMALPSILNAGIATVDQVRGMLATFHTGMTDPEIDAVLGLVVADATRRKNLAAADQLPNK